MRIYSKLQLEKTPNQFSIIKIIGYNNHLFGVIIPGFLYSSFKNFTKPTKANKYFGLAPVIYLYDAFYVIGGRTEIGSKTGYLDSIGRMEPVIGMWSLVGNLQQARYCHNAIYDGQYLMVFGGERFGDQEEFLTERCTLELESGNRTTVNCFSQQPVLENYGRYPELVLVEDNFCKIQTNKNKKY